MSGEFLEKEKSISSREISSTFSCLPLEVIHDEDEKAEKGQKEISQFPQNFLELSDEEIFSSEMSEMKTLSDCCWDINNHLVMRLSIFISLWSLGV